MKPIPELKAELEAARVAWTKALLYSGQDDVDAARAAYEASCDAEWIAREAALAAQTAKLAALAEYDAARDALDAAKEKK